MSSRVGRGSVGGHVLGGDGGGGGGGSSGFDPASRYDPTSMGRIEDNEIDPDAELFDHAENAANSQGMLGLGGFGGGLGRVRASVPTVSIDRRTMRAAVMGLAVVGCIVGGSVGIAYAAKNANSGGGGGGGGGGSESGGAEVQGAGTGSVGGGGGGGGGAPNSQGIAQFVAPPDDLAMQCAPLTVGMQSGWDQCKALCAAAECCFLPEGHWFSCRAENKEDCSAYEWGCATLDHVEGLRGGATEPAATDDSNAAAVSAVPAGAAVGAPRAVTLSEAPDAVCSTANLASRDGHNECEALCDAAACCSVSDDECSVTNPDACVSYEQPCIAYRETHDTVLEGAAAQCHTDALSAPEGVQGCKDYCSGAMDCFDGDALYADAWCEQYGPCHALSSLSNSQGFADAAEAAGAIVKACETDFTTCKNVCHSAECCFQGEGGTSVCDANPGLATVDCDHYDACKILFSGVAEDEDEDGEYGTERVRAGDDEETAEDQEVITAVETACAEDNLKSVDGFQDCHDKCAPYLCCFSALEAENCYDDAMEDCELYSACERAYEPEQGDEVFDGSDAVEPTEITKDVVDEACSSVALDYGEEGVRGCRSVCSERMCCVLPAGMRSNCEDTLGEEECRTYESCGNLIDAEDDVVVIEEGAEGLEEDEGVN